MRHNHAFSGNDRSAARWYAQGASWWEDHWNGAVDQTVEFLAGDGLSLDGATVLDIGCGDGIFALGLCRRTQASKVLAMDLVDVDLRFLNEIARQNGENLSAGSLPEFMTSKPDSIPLSDRSIDIAVAWSVFEHVTAPEILLREIRRVLRPSGVLIIQIWPLYYSEHGSHLWPFFDEPFVQLRLDRATVRRALEERQDPEIATAMFDLYESCNRITIDDLQLAVRGADLFISKVELLHNAIHVPEELQDVPLSKLGIAGVKLLATRTS